MGSKGKIRFKSRWRMVNKGKIRFKSKRRM